MPKPSIRSTRLEARISPKSLAIVRRAAEIQGRSLSDFVVAAAQQAAERAIEETQIIRLAVDDQRSLAASILDAPKPAPALRRARQAHRRLIAQSR
jgi:uncharacterized protein (DUF1778 family)